MLRPRVDFVIQNPLYNQQNRTGIYLGTLRRCLCVRRLSLRRKNEGEYTCSADAIRLFTAMVFGALEPAVVVGFWPSWVKALDSIREDNSPRTRINQTRRSIWRNEL
jgi:hypothetical protein